VTESEWLASDDPGAMLALLTRPTRETSPLGPVSDRKLRLFACACCRQVWDRLLDEQSRLAVQTAERYADGHAGERLRRGAWRYLDLEAPHGPAWALAFACCEEDLPRWIGETAAARDRLVAPAAQAALLRCLVGNPFRPLSVELSPGSW